jgi:IS5 family transposase
LFGAYSQPRAHREMGTQDMFRSRLDQIINMSHEHVKLSKSVSWDLIEQKCSEVYAEGAGYAALAHEANGGLASSNTLLISLTRSCATAG